MKRSLAALLAVGLSCTTALAQDWQASLAHFEKTTTVKVLPNGLTLIISERHEAPVFSFYTMIDAGSVDDPQGQGGLAHMFEHMAFKGTDEIGTTNYAAEKIALSKVEKAYAAYDEEQRKRVGKDIKKLETLDKAFEDAKTEAQKYVVPNQFTVVAEQNGAEGVNAETAEDSTQYFWSMPSNRLELWAYLESGRLAHPVYREFYKERDVVQEERRMRTDSSPIGDLFEKFQATAYAAHPYRNPGVGWESEISQVSATEAEAFHKKYYVGPNIVVAIVGDIDTKTALPMLERYFGKVPTGEKPEGMTTIEPKQEAEKSVTLHSASQPFYIEGYHRPDYRDPDDAVYDAISDILSTGRTGRLYRSLVRDQRIAAAAEGGSGWPGIKYPGMFIFEAVPVPGHTPEQMGEAIHKELDKMKSTEVTDEELQRYKARSKAELLRGLDDNTGIARDLAANQVLFADWRHLFTDLEKVDKVTKADIRRVANTTFVQENRTIAEILFNAPAKPDPANAGGGQ